MQTPSSSMLQQQQTSLNNNNTASSGATNTTDALIINSNSTVVSDELILQLQEQFGDSKQIYILNTSNNSVSSSSAYNSNTNASNTANNTNTIQYLIVDKDVDINAILQDPSLFQNQQTSLTNQTHQQQPNHHLNHNISNKNQSHPQQQQQQQQQHQQQQLLTEESIQRVQAPPPKRKQFEFKLDLNKRMSYQDAFLKYLAGEKQPTLEINTNDHANKKPKDNIYYNFYLNNPKLTTQTSTNLSQSTPNSNNTILNSNTNNNSNSNTATSNNTISVTSNTNNPGTVINSNNNGLDKENYYNSSRRENLLPLNNYEYRNSYKDHYDNQGVRLNPAIFKNLPSYSTTSTTPSGSSVSSITIQSNKTKQTDSINSNSNSKSSSIILAKSSSSPKLPNSNEGNLDLNEILSSNQIVVDQSKNTTLNDHTYKSISPSQNNTTSSSNINNNLIKDTQSNELDLNLSLNLNLKRKSNNPHDVNDLSNSIIEADLKLKQPKLDTDMIAIEHNNTPDIIPLAHTPAQIDQHSSAESVAIVDTNPNVESASKNDQMTLIDDITFMQGEFLIHKPTFSGDFDNYEIWCVLDDQYLQKYEPVLLSTGERCHQSADVLAQYTANKSEFLLVKVEEKGKTENNNIVVGVFAEYEPKNNPKIAEALISPSTNASSNSNTNQVVNNQTDVHTPQGQLALNQNHVANDSNANVVVVTYDDLKSAFDVFLQVMSSQCLNGEFLIKIKELQDEYFKPSIEFIETILNEKYNLLFSCLNTFLFSLNDKVKNCSANSGNGDVKVYVDLKQDFKYMLENKPKLLTQKVEYDSPSHLHNKKKCESLNYYNEEMWSMTNDLLINDMNLFSNVLDQKYLIQFSGNLYDLDTLVPLNTNGMDFNDKQYFVCSKMYNLISLLHSLKHFKFAYLEICSQKVIFI